MRFLRLPQGFCTGSDLRLLYVRGRRTGGPDAPSPNKLFHSPPERGKAIVDLDTKGKFPVWDLSYILVFSKVDESAVLKIGLQAPQGEVTEKGDKKRCGD